MGYKFQPSLASVFMATSAHPEAIRAPGHQSPCSMQETFSSPNGFRDCVAGTEDRDQIFIFYCIIPMHMRDFNTPSFHEIANESVDTERPPSGL